MALVEVLVSATLFALVAVGVLAGMDAASATSGANKSRAVASGIAQADLERLRAMRTSDLSNLREVRRERVGGVAFRVVSRGDWVTDSSGTESCTSADARIDYIRITSQVTWPHMHGLAPIKAASIVAPRRGTLGANQGSLGIQVRDRSGVGVPDVPVGLTGPPSFSEVTNSLGCVLFGLLPVGTYTIDLSKPGYVNRQGQEAVQQQASVLEGALSTVAIDYDRAATLAVAFDTHPLPQSNPTSAQAETISVANSGLAAPGIRTFGTGSTQSTISAGSLFPFTEPYAVYSGNCTGADPRAYGRTATLVSLAPGGTSSATVREPALNITVTRGGGPLSGARVRVTAKATGCGGTLTYTTDGNGRLPEPGMPYGIYDVCADDGSRSKTLTGLANDHPNGSAQRTLDIPTSGPTGTCP